jgi:hypothetical protein
MVFTYQNLTDIKVQAEIYVLWTNAEYAKVRQILIKHKVISNCNSCWSLTDCGDYLHYLYKNNIWLKNG